MYLHHAIFHINIQYTVLYCRNQQIICPSFLNNIHIIGTGLEHIIYNSKLLSFV